MAFQTYIMPNTLLSTSFLFLQFPISVVEVDSVIPTTASAAAVVKVHKLPKWAPVLSMATLPVSAGQVIDIHLSLTLPAATKLNKDAPSFWSLSAEGAKLITKIAGKKDLKKIIYTFLSTHVNRTV